MTASSPSFGVGIGRYYSRSGEFSSPELLESFPPAIHENAHNNFLQILAELGVVGFAVVMWLLWSAARYVPPAPGGRPARAAARGASPPDCWRSCSRGWAVTRSSSTSPRSRSGSCWDGRRVGRLALDSRPVRRSPSRLGRARRGRPRSRSRCRCAPTGRRRTSTWSIAASGLSAWHDAIDGVRYRLAGAVEQRLPARRRTDGGRSACGPIRHGGRVSSSSCGSMAAPPTSSSSRRDRWHYLRLALPRDRDGPRFRRLDLQVAGRSSQARRMS